MNTGSTSVLELASRRPSHQRTTFVRIVLTSTLACALVTSVHAQRAQAPQNTQQLQEQGLRQVTRGRLTIPVTGSLTTPGTPTPPVEPPTPEPPVAPPTTPPPDPTTPPTPPTTPTEPPAIPPTTPTPGGDAEVPEVTGSFSIRRFAQTTTGDVAAVGILTLSLTDPASNAARTIVTQAAMPVTRSGGEAGDSPTASPQGCETLSLALGPLQLDVVGMTVQLDQMNVDFISRSSGRLGIVLCGATSVIGSGVGPAEQMNILNTLLDSIG